MCTPSSNPKMKQKFDYIFIEQINLGVRDITLFMSISIFLRNLEGVLFFKQDVTTVVSLPFTAGSL